MMIYCIFNKNNGFIIDSEKLISINGIITHQGHIINKKQILKHPKQFKDSIKKLSSIFYIHANQKIMLIYYNLRQKNHFLYILFKINALKGIIIPKTSFASKNAIYGYDFPFKMPFHPGPDINEPLPEDPGDDTDD
ncbi:hypothetical protein [Acidiplasma cupricumulans]|uniref:Uncharacterized protein n=3 Tax=Acidiplasma TaxID=507753 RepID=A0A0N8VKW7_9ARCH|nr:hypothetical protein [Acidiplasma cupricumulans]KQB34876.1 hypothetical protein AOG55_08795 [Acidiplasma cupricumulans]